MSFLKSKTFKYVKNLIIGVGAALVMLGALWKIQAWEMPVIGGMTMDFLTIGLVTEAIIFLFLGIIGPEPDYYWENLYPGLDNYNGDVTPITGGASSQQVAVSPLNGEAVENKLGGMLTELQGMSRSLGSLKALQEVDFSQTGDQLANMNNFYSRMQEAMAQMNESAEDAKVYKEQMKALNENLASLNNVYGGMLSAMGNKNRQA